jgi:diguanylate cyclase (GGDEF)-like protein
MSYCEEDKNINGLVRLSFFTDIGVAITSARTMREMLDRVMEKIGTIFVPLNWSLLLRNSKTGELTFKIAIGEHADSLIGVKISRGVGIVGWIAENGKSLIIEDVSRDERFIGNVDKITGFTTKSIIGVPLKVNGKVFGVIELINKLNGESFSSYELKLLQTIADFAAVALEKFYYLKAMKRIASMDGLTEVLNRRSFDRILVKEIERCKRYNHPLSVLMLDIDCFKQINDKYGHPSGDDVLKKTAEILSTNIRLTDSVYRYGGDEFVILMPDTSIEDAEIVRRRIINDREILNAQEDEISVSYSIGLHSAGPDGVDNILSNSDIDLYRQKDVRKTSNFENLNDHVEEFLDEEE